MLDVKSRTLNDQFIVSLSRLVHNFSFFSTTHYSQASFALFCNENIFYTIGAEIFEILRILQE